MANVDRENWLPESHAQIGHLVDRLEALKEEKGPFFVNTGEPRDFNSPIIFCGRVIKADVDGSTIAGPRGTVVSHSVFLLIDPKSGYWAFTGADVSVVEKGRGGLHHRKDSKVADSIDLLLKARALNEEPVAVAMRYAAERGMTLNIEGLTFGELDGYRSKLFRPDPDLVLEIIADAEEFGKSVLEGEPFKMEEATTDAIAEKFGFELPEAS